MFHRRRRAQHVLSARRVTRGWCFLLVASLASACAGPTSRRTTASYVPPTTVAAAVTLAPPVHDPEFEFAQLERLRTAPALLRRAHLALLLRRPQEAIDAAAEVLYGANPPSANDESFARHLRAEAYELQGQAERGRYDRQRAAELALDVELRRLLAARPAPGAAAPAPDDALADLVVQPRSAWQARAADPRNVEPMGGVHRITIHHSAMYFRDTRPATCAAQIHMIQREHMRNRGYGDIGYHFLIDPSGRVWQGRELRWQGAHASGDNNVGNVGICLLGNFVRGRTGQEPTPAQVRSMRRLVTEVMRRHRIGPESIYSHSDFKATDCPGPLMEPVVDDLVRDLHRDRQRVAAAGD